MNDSVSENGRVNNSPDNTQNVEDLKTAREKIARQSGSEPPFRIFGYDRNDKPIPEEQAQLIDPPKSSSVISPENKSSDGKPPWVVNISSENSSVDSSFDDKKNEEKHYSVIPNSSAHQPSLSPNTNDAFPVNENRYNSHQSINPVNSSFVFSSNHSIQSTADPYYMNATDRSAVNRKLAFSCIEIETSKALHDVALHYDQEKKRQNQHSNLTATPEYNNSGEITDANKRSASIDWKDIGNEFIKKYAIVQVKKPGKKDRVVMILDEDENRHVEISSKDLEDYYISFIEDTYPDIEIATKNVSRAMLRLKHSIPKLEKSSLRQLEAHQVMFMNGFFDVKKCEFHSIAESERNQYYTTFSFDMDYQPTFNEPIVFNRLLMDALDGDKEAVRLAYEQIGAIFTPIPTLKKIFLFQGVSNAGKTRIGNIIARCMPEEDTLVLNNLSELTKEKLDSYPLRLVLIKELDKNKLHAKKIATLKALSDGSTHTAFTKVLMSTNYPIYTDEGGSIELALRNRLSTLPFPKPMMNSDLDVSCFEDVHFENEKQGIIIWALQAFSEVLNNNNKFYKDFEPNICVNAENEDQFGDEEGVQPVVKDYGRRVISTKEIIEQLFDLSDEVNEEMTAKLIMDAVNNFSPEDKTRVKQEAVVRGKLGEVFGKEELKSRRIKGNTCYNLNWKSKE